MNRNGNEGKQQRSVASSLMKLALFPDMPEHRVSRWRITSIWVRRLWESAPSTPSKGLGQNLRRAFLSLVLVRHLDLVGHPARLFRWAVFALENKVRSLSSNSPVGARFLHINNHDKVKTRAGLVFSRRLTKADLAGDLAKRAGLRAN